MIWVVNCFQLIKLDQPKFKLMQIRTSSVICITLTFCFFLTSAQKFTLEDIKSYPFPTELTTAASGDKIAWAFDEQGKRNLYVANEPDFASKQLTNYTSDDGQELTSISISADGRWVVYARGGDHGSNWGDLEPVNPSFSPVPFKVSVWVIPYTGGEP
jgi:hypothetical protein